MNLMNEMSQRTKSIVSTSSISRCEKSSQQIYRFYHLPPSHVQTKYSIPPVMTPLARPVIRYCINTSTIPISTIAPIRIHLFSIFFIFIVYWSFDLRLVFGQMTLTAMSIDSISMRIFFLRAIVVSKSDIFLSVSLSALPNLRSLFNALILSSNW